VSDVNKHAAALAAAAAVKKRPAEVGGNGTSQRHESGSPNTLHNAAYRDRCRQPDRTATHARTQKRRPKNGSRRRWRRRHGEGHEAIGDIWPRARAFRTCAPRRFLIASMCGVSSKMADNWSCIMKHTKTPGPLPPSGNRGVHMRAHPR
jgi:hypothetical protein